MKINISTDERVKSEIQKIAGNAYYVVMGLLLVSFLVEMVVFDSFRYFFAEWVIFLIGCIYFGVGCMLKGHWDLISKPGIKSYLLYSVISSAIFTTVFSVINYLKWTPPTGEGTIKYFFMIFLIMFIFLFCLMFAAMFISGSIVKGRQKKLEDQYDDSEEN